MSHVRRIFTRAPLRQRICESAIAQVLSMFAFIAVLLTVAEFIATMLGVPDHL